MLVAKVQELETELETKGESVTEMSSELTRLRDELYRLEVRQSCILSPFSNTDVYELSQKQWIGCVESDPIKNPNVPILPF